MIGPALKTREHGLVDLLAKLCLAGEYHAAPRAAQGLVGGGQNDIETVIEGVADGPAGDQARDMRHVGHRISARFIGDRLHPGVVDLPWIGGKPGQQDLRFFLKRHLPHFVVVDLAGLDILHLVAHEVVDLGDVGDRVTVGEVAAVAEVHAQHGVAGLQQCEVGRYVGGGARVGLYIGMSGAEQGFGALDRERFDQIGVFLPAVIAPPRITLGILVVEYRRHGFHDGGGNVVLRRNEFDAFALALHFAHDSCEDRRILLL